MSSILPYRATPDCRICFQEYRPAEECVSLGCGHLFHLICWTSLNEDYQKKCLLCTSRVITKVPQYLTDFKQVIRRSLPSRVFLLITLQLTIFAKFTLLKKVDDTKLVLTAFTIICLSIIIKFAINLMELGETYLRIPQVITYPVSEG